MRPRIRTIKPEFFSSPTVVSMPSIGARYLAIGLMSMADDRGRIQLMDVGIRGYVFPLSDVSEGQFTKALRAVLEARFAWKYTVAQFEYLWLPNFWKHQLINRPSESPLPPHPDDPYGGLPVLEALRQFKAESRIDRGEITDESLIDHNSRARTRAGACAGPRSDPFFEVVVRLSERLGERVRANDPKARPDPLSKGWLDSMRLLLKDRDGDIEEVERIIDWSQASDFWRSNIRSPAKLRKQFSTLLLQSQRPANVVPIKSNADGMLDRLDAADAAERKMLDERRP